uniref:G-protein coupled receptors family 1 profile domain-containing protein n=1 Tax=Xenopus tropicalis TaxID=8364 RepID=A0A1B8XSK0_XENTR|eukprot:XP_017946229.1 PREDICTED: olfactory receptor 4C6-like [Xenopus tropicalis]
MENESNSSTSFLLLGLLEMERFPHVYCYLCILAYTFIILLSSMIVLVILTEESCRQPMYILICTVILNGMFGSSTFFPKLIMDLLLSSTKISRTGCLLQVLCVTTYTIFEVSSLTVMAYDRYLAVCHPLHYVYLMTNEKALKFIGGAFIFSFTSVLIAVLLSARLPFCGTRIKNIFCDNMSLVILSCVDTSANTLYGTVSTTLFLAFTLVMIAYSYLRIFMVCLKVSKEACEKAIHTLVTHLMNFSIFLIGVFFILFDTD